MCKIHLYTVLSLFICGLLATIFFAQFGSSQIFGFKLGNPGEYSVLQLISLFYNVVIMFFLERIRQLGKFYLANSADCFPCLTTTCGILASFWALVLAVSLVNAREIFIQTGLFFLFSFLQTISLLLSSCWKQIEYDNLIRNIVIDKKDPSDLYVNYDVASKQSPKSLRDQATKTDNEVLNVVELNDKQSDDFLKIRQWADQLSKARGSNDIDVVACDLVREMKQHYSQDFDVQSQPRPSVVSFDLGLDSKAPNNYDLEKASLSGTSSSSSSSLLSLLPDTTLPKY
ncbi:hypothetical protein M3Y97_00616200 [Aphelenchoides bicaudatus]|nr:hypothetical protein M3Y97_00616200 [Aphelenchoides bicaudatus]